MAYRCSSTLCPFSLNYDLQVKVDYPAHSSSVIFSCWVKQEEICESKSNNIFLICFRRNNLFFTIPLPSPKACQVCQRQRLIYGFLSSKSSRWFWKEHFLCFDISAPLDSVGSVILKVIPLELRLKETLCVEADWASRPVVGQFDFYFFQPEWIHGFIWNSNRLATCEQVRLLHVTQCMIFEIKGLLDLKYFAAVCPYWRKDEVLSVTPQAFLIITSLSLKQHCVKVGICCDLASPVSECNPTVINVAVHMYLSWLHYLRSKTSESTSKGSFPLSLCPQRLLSLVTFRDGNW